MTRQEMFNAAARQLLNQGGPALTPGGPFGTDRCAYRGPNGTRCAVGALIPDELYDPAMEGKPVWTVMNEFPAVYRLFHGVRNETFLGDLQAVHDSLTRQYVDRAWDRHVLLDRLERFAKSYDLSRSVLQEFR